MTLPVLVAPDSFKGTFGAPEVAGAIAAGLRGAGRDARELPVADGGEGTLDVLGGPNRTTTVTGPLGEPVEAGWRMTGRTAIIEMARASGLVLAGGAENNDPVGASSAGTGELVAAALDAGAKRILVGLGGSATTDGGLPALRGILRDLPPDAVGTAIIEVPAEGDVMTVEAPQGVQVQWVPRDVTGDLVGQRALRTLQSTPVDQPNAYAFVVGESSLATQGRRTLHEAGLAKSRITFSGFWKA